MSDHLVMWVEVKIDGADEWLKGVKAGTKGPG